MFLFSQSTPTSLQVHGFMGVMRSLILLFIPLLLVLSQHYYCATTTTTTTPPLYPSQVVAQELRPTSLRARFGSDRVRNAVHCSDLPEDGPLEVSGGVGCRIQVVCGCLPSVFHYLITGTFFLAVLSLPSSFILC